jgi:ssDNA-binding Zn-finger/Zn-ribbon topoisomerase 1
MGMLTETAFAAIVEKGCTACGGRKLAIRTTVDGRVPFYAGAADGDIVWVYDGEKFIDGVFEIACASCRKVAFSSDGCPRCHQAKALATALAAGPTLAIPRACPKCGEVEIHALAFVPARVTYEGRRVADRVRSLTEPDEPGFHAFRITCPSCGPVAEIGETCPLCGSPGPLRERP